MKMKKILGVLLTVVALGTMLAGCGTETKKVYSVGIVQLTQHPALDAATEGFKQALIDKLGEENVKFDEQIASGEATVCTTIVNSFISKKVDLIMANATPALQAAYNATSTIPILGTSVTEYGVALGIDNFTGIVGTNVSGTSDLAPLDEQAAMFTELLPDAKTVGLLYCSAEPNSEYQVKVVEEALKAKGLTCTRFSFSDTNDVSTVTADAAAKCDALYIPTDNTAASCASTIGNIVRDRKVPVIAGEAGICEGCGIATLSISYKDLGYKTGEMAAKILTGEAKVSEMPVEYATAAKKYNPVICKELGIDMTAHSDYTALD